MPVMEIPTSRGKFWGNRFVKIRCRLMNAPFQLIPKVVH
jgi:hypothetical protein